MDDSTSPTGSEGSGGEANQPVLRLDSIVRRFGGITAVDGVSLTLSSQQRLAIIGPNGAGKTTLFRVIAGEMRPTSGRIELFGRDVTRLPPHERARMGLSRTFQVSNLFAGMSVLENVRLAAQAKGRGAWRFWSPVRPAENAHVAARATLDELGIGHRADARVADLSHGEQRQLEIAMAMVAEPRILLLDEPAAGLAAGERAQLRRVLERLPRTVPLILIEHDMSLAMGIADRVLCLDNGRQIALGSPAAVRDDARVQAVYLGRQAIADA